MRGKYSLSTCWLSQKIVDSQQLINTVKDAGFDSIECEYRISEEILSGIKKSYKEKEINISSVHNYCPVPDILKPEQGSGDAFSLASLDESERDLAVKYTIKSIELADYFGGVPVVLHCGKVQGVQNPYWSWVPMIQDGKSEELVTHRRVFFKSIEKQLEKHESALKKSLDKLNEFAYPRGIRLGLEARMCPHELPRPEGFRTLLDEFKGGAFGYWHDVGHAQLTEYFGICSHDDFISWYADDLIGIHLMDIHNERDHLAPGQGSFDYMRILKYLRDDVVRVFEINSSATKEMLSEGQEYLRKIGI